VRYGLIADIHANVEALEAVLRFLDAARVDGVVCLGDIVGYHANPNECVGHVRARCARVIAGNHDRATVGAIGTGQFGFVARRAVAWTAAHLAPGHAAFLRGLPISLELDATACIVHAGLAPEPNDRFHITTPARIAANLARVPIGGVCFFGHTHRPVVHVRAGAAAGGTSSHDGMTSVELALDRAYLINPGSVGQSRDRDWRAACAVYDAGARRVEFARLEYDRAACRATADAAGLLAPPTAAERGVETARSFALDAASLARRIWRHRLGLRTAHGERCA
jgi:predicted phosphodiesterase